MQQRLLQRVEGGELLLVEGFETLRFFANAIELPNDGPLDSRLLGKRDDIAQNALRRSMLHHRACCRILDILQKTRSHHEVVDEAAFDAIRAGKDNAPDTLIVQDAILLNERWLTQNLHFG